MAYQMEKILTPGETTELEACEEVIARHLETFTETGAALLKIRDGRLYRARYKTFEAYCQERWGWSGRHANRQIEAAVIAKNLGPIGLIADHPGVKPKNESQVRPLAKLPAGEQRAAWETAVREAGDRQPTAAVVAQVVRRHPHRAATSVFRPRPQESPLCQSLRRKREAEELRHGHVIDLMLALESLGEPQFDPDQAAAEILMADRRRLYEKHAHAAQGTLARLIRAMARVRFEGLG